MSTISSTRLPHVGTAERIRTEQQVLELITELEDPDSWLYRHFYGHAGIAPTRLTHSPGTHYGHDVLLKDETTHTLKHDNRFYNSASFKRRGALLAGLLYLRTNPNLRTFVTASHGNHGIGVAMAAKTLGVRTVIYCPESVNGEKLKKLRSLGAVVHSKGLRTFENAMSVAYTASERRDAVLIHPFDQPEVIAGQATIGLEVVRDLIGMSARSELDLSRSPVEVCVAVAGGGLLTGVSIVLKRYKDLGILDPNSVRLYGAQMVGCDAARRCVADFRDGGSGVASFEHGEFNDACDSTAVRDVGSLTLPFLADSEYVQGFRLVNEAQVGRAMKHLSSVYGKRIEPAGALAYAAAKQQCAKAPRAISNNTPRTTFVVPVCGANVTPEAFDYFQSRA